MFRLLIADDEELVRRGLTALVEREARGVTVVGVAADGVEALELAHETSPDIVLTDIRMPGLDGLDLIEQLRHITPQPRCVILSGYSDFDYARRAIGLDVADYLLKPVDPDALLGILARVADQIAVERAGRETYAETARLAAEHALHRLLSGLDGQGDVACRIPPAPAHGLLLVQAVRRDDADLADDCRRMAPEAVVVVDAYGYVCILLPLQAPGRDLLAPAAVRLQKALAASGWMTAVTVARPCDDVAAVAACYQEALDVADYHGCAHELGPLLCWDVLPAGRDHWPALPMRHRDAILDAITAGSTGEAAAASRSFMQALRHQPPGALRSLWFEMVVLVISHVHQQGVRSDALLDAQHNLRSFLASPTNAHRLGEELDLLVARAARAQHELRQGYSSRGTIAGLRAYIEGHLGEDLAITTLARRMNLNAKYLGELFKETTGEPLGRYIIRARMRRACHLLTDTHQKVYAIAQSVGYGDAKHFTTMFRSVVGMSPVEYREQHTGQRTEPGEAPPCQP